MEPIYIPNFIEGLSEDEFLNWANGLPWESRTEARQELFMSDPPGVQYTYGQGPRGERAYTSIELDNFTRLVLDRVNNTLSSEWVPKRENWGPLNGAFLNRYNTKKNALGWHSDDFKGMDHTKAVVVVSFGEEREIWWREKGTSGIVPENQRRKLAFGSAFIMPPGFQQSHDHKIPKGDREMKMRVSLTFRAFLEQ